MNKLLKIIHFFLEDLAKLFPYFLFFYLICLSLSMFSERWKLYFNWPIFHVSLFFMAGLYILNKFYTKQSSSAPRKTALKLLKVQLKPRSGSIMKPRLDLGNSSTIQIVRNVTSYFLGSWIHCIIVIFNLNPQKRGDYLKVFIIGAILFYALYQQTSLINFMILVYGLRIILSPLTGDPTKVSAFIAISMLIVTALLSMWQLSEFAEQTAVAAYYFLCFSTLTGLINLIRSKPELYTAP